MGGGVVLSFRNRGENLLGLLQALCLELLFLDQCEGVHQNLLQRLKPRCLLEIELRHTLVANV